VNRATPSAAFTLIEVLLVVVVIGIMATMTIPRLTRKPPTAEWETVLDELNNLVYYARQKAISSQQVYRLHFESTGKLHDIVQVEIEKDNPEKPGQKLYLPEKSYYFNPIYKFPAEITIQAVYHGKKNMLEEHNNHAYCYIIPNGLVQDISLHLERTQEEETTKKVFKTSPFFGKFEIKD
jgi:prepilin-type N-terminal cleavage/methylation domain-containing protein